MSENLNSEDLLKEQTYIIVIASIGKHFANFIIDLIFYIVLLYIFLILIKSAFPDLVEYFDKKFLDNFLIERLIATILYGFTLGIIEGITRGKSLGKIITNTRVVNEDGSEIGHLKGILRGLCRAVPFNGFSVIGSTSYLWHDKWTKTFVVDEKLSDSIPT